MPINRRQMLAGTIAGAGGLTVSPFMHSVMAAVQRRSEDNARPPMRFVFLIKSNGLWAEMIQPKGMTDRLPFKLEYDEKGRLVNSDHGNIRKSPTPAADIEMEEDTQLSDVMQSLQPYAGQISILQGINSGFSTYHMGCYQTLGGFQARDRNSRQTKCQTVDSMLAHAFPAPIRHVCLGHDPNSPSGVAYVPTSAEGAGKPIPFYTRPKRAYKERFGVVYQGAARNEYDVQTGILDFYSEDAKRVRKNVAGPEREQLDRYLSAFESIKESRRAVESISDQLRKHAPAPPQEVDANATMKIGQGNADIAIASLLSGLTNVVTLRFDLLGSTSYEGIGGLHGGVGHGQVKNVLKARQTICRFQFDQIARIAAALKSIPEGDGTMLDHTVFAYTSDNGETHHSSGVNFPIMLLGDMGGRLKTRRYFAPGDAEVDRSKPGYTRLGDVWATLIADADHPSDKFGLTLNGVPHQPLSRPVR